MYNQPYRGNPPTPQQQYQMNQQQMQPATSIAQHQSKILKIFVIKMILILLLTVMASQAMRQHFSGTPHFHPQHPGQQQQHIMQMPPQLYPPNMQHQHPITQQNQISQHHQMNLHQQQMYQQQMQGLQPGQIGPMRPPHPMFPPLMGQQQQQQQGPQCLTGFPPQRFQQQPHQLPPMRQPTLNPQLTAPQQTLQQTSVMNPSIFAPPIMQQHNVAIQRPPSVSSPQQMPIQIPPLSQSLQPQPRPPIPVPIPPPQIMPVIPPIDVPYYDLPAGLMVPLVKPGDHSYKPIDPKLVKLPPPQAPSEKLLRAVEEFYAPPSHEKPRDADGWEHGALSEFFKLKQEAIKRATKNKVFTENLKEGENKKELVRKQESIPKKRYKEEKSPNRKRSSRRSRSKSPKRRSRSKRKRSSSNSSSSSNSDSSSGSSRSRSRSPKSIRSRKDRHHPGRHDRGRSGNGSSNQTRKRSRSRSPEEFKPSFTTAFEVKDRNSKLEDTNKGAQLLLKMGWSGTGGLGSSQQGISEPVPETGTVRDSGNMYHGIGVEQRSDAYDSYRKSKGQAFLDRIQRTRDDK